jgi:hypothetical protein
MTKLDGSPVTLPLFREKNVTPDGGVLTLRCTRCRGLALLSPR